MSDKKKEKKFWELRFNISNPNSAPESIVQFGYPDSDIKDADIDFLTRKVKRIDVLVLRESEVTDVGISYLSRLDSLRELDIKNCTVDDSSLQHILNLTSLEYLHIKFTGISKEGIARLAAMKSLNKLVCCWPKEHREEGEALIAIYNNKELILDYK